ncbi:hypothetical protein [Owenweeksia hongkongensis]|uniref:hypothetical protein n=1 Tax=Owenweeksia hongkongensis TaxID=253245 RepID=UPI003A8FE2EC
MLMAIMLFQSTGMYLMHSVQVAYVRHEMKQRIKAGVPEADLVLLKIAKSEEENSDIFEREHSREFRYYGQMYDVMRLEDKGDTTYYTCIHDVKESKLFERLDRMVLDQLSENEDQKKHREMMLGFFTKVYLPTHIPDAKYFNSKVKSVFTYRDFFSEKHCHDFIEPPRYVSFS